MTEQTKIILKAIIRILGFAKSILEKVVKEEKI
jgi:hypothetical protein